MPGLSRHPEPPARTAAWPWTPGQARGDEEERVGHDHPRPPRPLQRQARLRQDRRARGDADAPGHGNSFMVQKHDATRLHWDFRLEVDGVLKSWAVTRGPSLDPDEKAARGQDRGPPAVLCHFRGDDPQGAIWRRHGDAVGPRHLGADRGQERQADIDKGHLHFVLDGERMKGEWMLIRLKPRGREKNENWLLRKVTDGFAGGTDALVDECADQRRRPAGRWWRSRRARRRRRADPGDRLRRRAGLQSRPWGHPPSRPPASPS